ncbi:type II secretion system protein GspL [Pseudomonas sp. DTU12.3]|uniref:type II secretion system protein GspL n=1 Tax=Pseudomonas sp. DTU12.3 TaxID=2073078 RepID=UPI001013B72A|nr:type II secretion system protein GspL [Pseudomonas sp. DTU12.3]QAX84860.1 type II secretion system protein GspL [Pseudomonas sp. DTU12.3]
MSQLRIALPPLAELDLHSELRCAWLDRQGQVSREDRLSLSQLAQTAKLPPLVCFLHPLDSLLASIDLPPLPANKIAAAVQCAAQALMLGDCNAMHIAHGPRDEAGQVQIAWAPRERLQLLGQMLKHSALNLRGLYPAPYGLPVLPGTVACVQDDHLLLRESVQAARVQPLFEEGVDSVVWEPGTTLHWIGDQAPSTAEVPMADAQRWTGPLPGWGLHGAVQQPRGEHRGWGRAIGLCVLAVAVWVIGLNLYAAREASQGQQLKTQMNLRVKQAFPELPVILNPLQQARQQLAARQKGAADDPAQTFNRLVLQAGSGMPFMAGSVEQLSFVDDTLQLRLLSEARRMGSDKEWQSALAQAGISVTADDDGWTLRASGETSATENDDSSGAEDE